MFRDLVPFCNVVSSLVQADNLASKFEESSETRHIDEAITLNRQALDHCTPGQYHLRRDCLRQLAWHIYTRYKQLGGTENLNEAIDLARDALVLYQSQKPSMLLNNLGVFLYARYRLLGGVQDLDEAIVLNRKALVLRPPGHQYRPMSLNNLANDICARYELLGRMEDLDEAIVLSREALALCLPGHMSRSKSLNNLALDLCTRYGLLGRVEDLDEAITLDREVLMLLPPGNPDRSITLNNLADHLCTRYGLLGRVEDLDEAIALDREALVLFLPGHPGRSTLLNNFADHLSTRYNLSGRVQDLDEAIILNRDALVLSPPGHPDRSILLNGLAKHLHSRYNLLRGVQDLDEAILLARDALVLCPLGHPGRSSSLINLAGYLCAPYYLLGGAEHLDEAIVLDREALVLCPPGNSGRSISLNNLASHLSTRYDILGGVQDLDEAILLDRDALILRPPGHPDRSISLNNLANHLHTRYKLLNEVQDLEEAIVLNRDALVLCPSGHPSRSLSLSNLTNHLCTRYNQTGDVEDREEMFRLYSELACGAQSVSSDDLSATKAWIDAAEHFHHSTTLLAYKTALGSLVQHLATLPSLPQNLAILKPLTSSLAVDAFSACLRNQSSADGVELLEQGRGVFWSQLTRLRSPLEDVIASGPEGKTFADDFTRLTSLIRKALDSPGADQHEQVWRLNLELQTVVSNIRELPGFSRFLLPSLFVDLQQAASGGPVIILNASKYGCDALVVIIDRDPIHIPLSITKEDVQELSSKLRTLIVRSKRSDMTRDLSIFLRQLWDRVVSPIVDFLRTICPPQSRIWWCPTAEFSLLPLHAANPFRQEQKSLAQLYISSYTPTLTALIRARQSNPSNLQAKRKRFLAVGQANASGTHELCSVGTELANIGQCIDGLAKFTRTEGKISRVSKVLRELSKNGWVHLACHGIPNTTQPFESAFALHDGHLTIQRIIQCNLKNSEFAYLSACHTTVGDEESPDEVIHLAAAMQFAGFRSVIGTMWAVDDAETNKITSVFYKHMTDESGCLDHTRAAYALSTTMRMKSVNIPLDQRILYIHIGA